jgi:2'-5' RNA ligase
MSVEKSLCGLGIFLAGETARRVNRWRRLYDPSYPGLAPHISLAYPPFVQPVEWQQVRGAIAECLHAYPPFRIYLDGVGTFSSQPMVLWLNPIDGGVLVRMRKSLEACFPEYVPIMPFEFQPHVSIGFFESEVDLGKAYGRVQAVWKPIEFMAEDIVYAVQVDEHKWEIIDRIPLPGSTEKHL